MEKEDYLHLIVMIEECSLGKLSKHFEEKKYYVEYNIRINNLEKNNVTLRQLLAKYDLRQGNEAIEIISLLKILHEELMTKGQWNDQKAYSIGKLIDNDFETLYKVSLQTIFTSKSVFHAQDILDMCLEKLNSKLSTENFKQYPSLIEVYSSLIHEIQDSNLIRMPPKALLISSLLMNDYDPGNKVKGLKCCKIILRNLWSKDFDEVTFQTLNKLFKEKDLEITKLLVECQFELMRILPLDNKTMKMDVVLSVVLEEILLDANFHRKTVLMGLLQQMIAVHGINCVSRKKSFNSVICDSVEMCTSISIREVMLADILQCTEIWIKYCWAAWNYRADQKLLRMMFKTLYVLTEKEELYAEIIQNLIVSLIFLCEKEEQEQIIMNLKKTDWSQNSIFFARLDVIVTRLTG